MRMVRSPTMLALLILAQIALPCEDVAILSHDGRYMLMDGSDLTITDVGNLRWKDVWGVDVVIPGSTSDRLAFVTDELRDAAWRHSDLLPPSALVTVGNLSEADGGQMHMSVSRDYDFEIGDALWIDGTDELLVWQRRRSTFHVLDGRLNIIDEWFAPNVGGVTMACRQDGQLFIAGGGSRFSRSGDANVSDVLDRPEGAEDCSLEHQSVGCRASLGCRRDGEYEKAIVDIASNRLVRSFQFDDPLRTSSERSASSRTYMSSLAFIGGGAGLLRQIEVWVPNPPGANSFRVKPGALLRVLDTRTGSVVAENGNAPTGKASRIFCRGHDERVVLSAAGEVHLIDLITLQPVASARVPFARHFVF